MNFTREEKIILVFFTILLLTGAIFMHIVQNHTFGPAIGTDVSLKDIERQLKESRRIDINIASINDFAKIPGIGYSIAERIISYRESRGGFMVESDLMKVKGIGQKKFEKMREYIKI